MEFSGSGLSEKGCSGLNRFNKPIEGGNDVLLAGKVVEASKGRLTVTDLDGTNQRTFDIAQGARFMCNGQEYAYEEFHACKEGSQVNLYIERLTDGTEVITEIEAAPE